MKSWVGLALPLVCISNVADAVPRSADPSAAASSITGDEIAIYEAVLASWLDGEKGRQLVNEELSAPPSKGDPEFRECTKGRQFPASALKAEHGKSLAGVQFKRRGIQLIDGSQWSPTDPGRAIANGKSVETAVGEGFSHSLISFSQIAFSRDGKEALVKFSMACGSLCGSGSTIRLHKSAAGWAIASRCGGWIS